MNTRHAPLDALRPEWKLWLSLDGEGVFGSGKWNLLDAIRRTGSLSAAAQSLGISYRKAWGALRKAEQCLGVSLIERHRGGRTGGESCLTEAGEKWRAEYARFQNEVETGVNRAFEHWLKRMMR